MTSLVSRTHLSSQTNQQNKMKLSRQPGQQAVSQKQFSEQTSRPRQPLSNLNNNSAIGNSTKKLKNSTKPEKDTVQLKAVSKSSVPKKIYRKTVHTPAPTATLDELPEIESLPQFDSKGTSDCPSPYVEPAYFKSLTDSLRNTSVVSSSSQALLNMDSLSTRLSLQQRPKELLTGLLECDEPTDQPLSFSELPPMPDFDW